MDLIGGLSQFVPGMGSLTGPKAQDTVSDLQRYKGMVQKYGTARTTMGMAIISHPDTLKRHALATKMKEVNELILPVYCDTFALPGIAVATVDNRRHGYGLVEKMPTTNFFVDISLSFIGDGGGEIHKYFYNWMNSIVRWENSTTLTDNNNNALYDVSYKSEYAVQIGLFVYNETNDQIQQIILRDAYPIFMGDVSMNWGDHSGLQRIPLTFTYRGWEYYDQTLNKTGGNDNTEGILGKALKTLNAVKAISTLKKPTNIGDIVNIVGTGSAVAGSFGLFK